MDADGYSLDDEVYVDDRMVVLKMPKSILAEMDALCDYNFMERSEFIIIAISQLLDYLDHMVGRKAWADDFPELEPVSLYDDGDDDILQAAENDEEE